MKAPIRHIIYFAAGLVVVLAMIQYSLNQLCKARVHNKVSRIFEHQLDSSIMIFGSSVANREFDPAMFSDSTGMSCYNMGIPGTSFAQVEPLVQELATYSTRCSCVVFACDLGFIANNRQILKPHLFYAYLNDSFMYDALHRIEPWKVWRARYIPGYQLVLFNKEFYQNIIETPVDDRGGFSPRAWQWVKDSPLPPNYASFSKVIYEEFKRTIGQLTRKHIKVILVLNPEYIESYEKVTNLPFIMQKYRELISKDVYLLDHSNDSINRHREYYYNFRHLNETGARIFSAQVGHEIRQILDQAQ